MRSIFNYFLAIVDKEILKILILIKIFFMQIINKAKVIAKYFLDFVNKAPISKLIFSKPVYALMVEVYKNITSKLYKTDRAILKIPNLAIHLRDNRDSNDINK